MLETSHEELVAKSSLHLVIIDSVTREVQKAGSGCLVKYRDRRFLLSVAHVTDLKGMQTAIETNHPPVDEESPLHRIESMVYFDEYPIPPNLTPAQRQAFVHNLKQPGIPLDITFGEVTGDLNLLQPEWDFGTFKIPAGGKYEVDLAEMMTSEMSHERVYDFVGRTRQEIIGKTLRSTVVARFGLKFQRREGVFLRFMAPEIIQDADDYRGCSGAPIFDDLGRLVGLACKVTEKTKRVYAFAIDECRRLLDLAITQGLV